MGVVVSSSHIVSAAPSSSGGGLLTLFPCSSVGSLPWETVLHELLQHRSFQWAAVLHELLQRGSLLTGCSPSGTGCSSMGPQRGHKPCQPTCSSVGSSLHGSACRVCMSWQEPAPVCAPHGVTASFKHPPALVWGPFHGLQVDICSTMDLHGLQGHSLPHHGLYHKLQGNLCSSSLSTSSSFVTDLGVCRGESLTYSHSSFL